MFIKNSYVYNKAGVKELKHLLIHKDGSKSIYDTEEPLPSLQDEIVIDAKGLFFLMAGMLDSHVHGQGGIDFAALDGVCAEEQLEHLVKTLGTTGLSYALATLVSMPIPALKKTLVALSAFIKKQALNPLPGHTQLVGVHLEGPFISKNCKGAHAEETLQERISIPIFKDIISFAPDIKHWKITLAPDILGAIEFIQHTKALEQEGIFVKVFIGHSNPDKELIRQAIEAGACGFTHLGNACQESCSRETRELTLQDTKSNMVQWVLENPELCPFGVELITDGVHLSPSFIALIDRAIKNKVLLITDALGPTGCMDALYKLGSLDIRKEHNSFYLADNKGSFLMKEGITASGEKGLVKTLAGSAATLALCAQHYFECMPDQSLEQCMDAIYSALITNPRNSSLSMEAIHNLPDHNNFVIFNHQGQLIFSACHGRIIEHYKLLPDVHSLNQHRFLSKPLVIESGASQTQYKGP